MVSILITSILSFIIRDRLAQEISHESIGYYFSASRIFELILGLAAAFYSTFYFKMIGNVAKVKARKIIIAFSSISVVVFSFIAMVLILFGDNVVLLLLSDKQLPSTYYFLPLAINMVLSSILYCGGFYLLRFYDKNKLILIEIGFFILSWLMLFLVNISFIVWVLPIVTSLKVVLNFILVKKQLERQ